MNSLSTLCTWSLCIFFYLSNAGINPAIFANTINTKDRSRISTCNNQEMRRHSVMVASTWIGGTGNWQDPSNWSTGLVPDGTTDVIIGVPGNVTIPDGITANAMSVSVQGLATLKIDPAGILNISNSTSDALTITASGKVTNKGFLNIGSAGAVAGHAIAMLNSLSQLTNESTATININNVTGLAFALNLLAKVINAGNINIGSVAACGGGFAMDNLTQLENQTTGIIQVNNIPAGDGFYVQNSTIINDGTIHCGNLSPILNRGISMELSSQFSNGASGTVTINNITNSTLNEGIGIYLNNSDFTNSGDVLIGNLGAIKNIGLDMYFEATYTNTSLGLTEINNITNLDGIALKDDFTAFLNSGLVNIGNNAPVKRIGIIISNLADFFNNFGSILKVDNITGLSSSDGYGLYIGNGAMTNSGSIQIGSLFSISRYGINVSAAGTLQNQSNGTIQINKITNFDAIFVSGTSSACTNNGSIQIGNLNPVKGIGITLLSSSFFTNSTSASISINNITGTLSNEGFGIYIGSSTYTNNGSIQIGNTAPISNIGIYVAAGTLNNQSSGNIQINNITNLDGMQCNGTGTTITNAGTIRIGNLNSVKRIGISMFSSSVFSNNSGSLEINTITSTTSGQGYGLYVSGSSTFTNNTVFNMGNLSNISRYGIYIAGPATFTNQANGVLKISRIVTVDAIVIDVAGAVLNNSGQIKLGEAGPLNRIGLFINTGGQYNNLAGSLLEINNVPAVDGIFASGTGAAMTNNGTINIGNTAGIYRFGILLNPSASLTNGATGTITINNILSTTASEGTAIRISNATLTNSNVIQIGNLASISRFGMVLSSSATLTNQAAGNIQINRISGFYGITLQTSAKIFNNGQLSMGNIAAINSGGIGIYTASEFNNNAGSTLSVNRISLFDAIEIADASSKMINNATINIGNTNAITRHGFNIYSSGLFQNNITGIVNMANIGGSAILLDGATSLFTNKGAVNM